MPPLPGLHPLHRGVLTGIVFRVSLQVQEFKVTEARINEAREQYRPAACRASLLYFTMNELHAIHPMYQFSLKVPALLGGCSLFVGFIKRELQSHRITESHKV